MILEVVDFTPPDIELTEAIHELATAGYSLTIHASHNPDDLHAVLDVADILKIDLNKWSPADLQDHVARCRQYNGRLLADHVTTEEEFASCIELGFDYFRGAFFGQPDPIEHHRSPTNRPSLLHLMTKLTNPTTGFSDLEDIIRRDVSLTYKLLRVLQTTGHTPPRAINSIRQALSCLGLKSLITWVSFILLSGLDDTPHELTTTAMVRAKMCELVAQSTGLVHIDAFFLVGLLSALHTLLGTSIEDLLTDLPVDNAIRYALLYHEGELGRILRLVLAYERGHWDDGNNLGIDSSIITDSYLRAIVWAEAHKELQ